MQSALNTRSKLNTEKNLGTANLGNPVEQLSLTTVSLTTEAREFARGQTSVVSDSQAQTKSLRIRNTLGISRGTSRDEMNLAEFPLAVLSTRVDPKVKTLEFQDTQRQKNGDLLERKWIITGADKFGLPTATDDDVVLGLMRITMDHDFRERKIYFTRYELLKILGWSTEGRSYSRLSKSLDRLSGVRIRATNAFFDNNAKGYQTKNFGIIDAYEINDHRSKNFDGSDEKPRSYFIWSEVLFDSFQVGFIKKLDLQLYFALKSAVSRRLYRYLDKHFYYRPSFEKPLLVLAFEKLGLSRSYKYVSSVRQQIEPAAEELVKIGFLENFEIEGRGAETRIRFFAKRKQNTLFQAPAESEIQADLESQQLSSPQLKTAQTAQTAIPKKHSVAIATAFKQTALTPHPEVQVTPIASKQDELIGCLLERGISSQQARRLMHKLSDQDLNQVAAIIKYFDHLLLNNDRRVIRNSVGFLYRAVEFPYKFSIPQEFLTDLQTTNHTAGLRNPRGRPELKIYNSQNQKTEENHQEAQQDRLKQYEEFVNESLGKYVKTLSAEALRGIKSSIEDKMACLRGVLNREKFREAVDGCVRDELFKRSKLPDFRNWLSQS